MLLCATLMGAALPAWADDEELARGEILLSKTEVPSFKEKQLRMEAVIERSPEQVWAIVTDCANFETTMPRTTASVVLARDGDTAVCRSTLDLTWPLPNLEATTRVVLTVLDGHWRSEWTLVSGDYKYNQGSWDLSAFQGDPNRTRVVYEVLAAPNIVIPDALRAFGATRALPSMIEGLRTQLGVPAGS